MTDDDTTKINIDDVIPPNAVPHAETPNERILRMLLKDIRNVAARVVIVVGLILGSIAAFAIAELRTQGFQLVSAVVMGALGFFFGANANTSGE